MGKRTKHNYDTTGGVRMKARRKRIKDSGLVERAIIMDAKDSDKVRIFAENLYKKRGKNLIP